MSDFIKYVVKVYASGRKEWFLNDKLHREDGPAVEWSGGTKYWFLKGKLHREGGPAIERADGTKSWYLNGVYFSESEWKKKTSKEDVCNGKVVEIDGKRYKLVQI